MGPFAVVWSGQVVTMVGSAALRFALVVEVWRATGQATQVVVLSLAAWLPKTLLSPTAGVIVDRLPTRTALRMADLGGLVAVGTLAGVYAANGLHLWQVYAAVALVGAAEAFQFPALSSAVPALVREEQLQRANGLLATARSTAEVGGPAIGGLLLAVSGVGLVLWVDLTSYVVALATIRAVRSVAPAGAAAEEEDGPPRRLLARSLDGLRFLLARPSLRGLTAVFFTVNLVMVFGFSVVQPMVLARSGDDAAVLAAVNSCIGLGGIAGGLLLAAWGGPRNRVRGMMLGVVGMCLSAQVVMASGQGAVAWCAAMFVGVAFMPIINGTMQALVQTKVPRERLGQVFGAVMFVSQISVPLAMTVSGPLADAVFEPQAAAGSGLPGLLAPLVGTGPGAGMATMLLLAGCCGAVVALAALAYRPVRDIDELVPDLAKADKVGGGG
jgi:MFS transporter, DHA3 family, macrolide efflux protein